jgi:nuclear pore complex protein Nup155
MMNVLCGRPAAYGINVQKPMVENLVRIPSYRISRHSGSDGFSKSAADAVEPLKSGSVARSARLSSWLLHPESVSLKPLAIQHLEPLEATFVALNIGGLHSYKYSSLLGQFRDAIIANSDRDAKVEKFFQQHGFNEGCTTCFMLMLSPLSDDGLKDRIFRTAMKHTYNPRLLANNDSHNSSFQPAEKNDPWVPNGYVFKSSALCEGLYMTAARLLRPIWYKPAVVVTEGRLVRRGVKSITTPAKVELLLDDETLNDVAGPLVEFQNVLGRLHWAIVNVPTRMGNNTANRGGDWLEHAAHRIEERNIHSLYRLVARTTQLLNLLYYLYRADAMPDIPEVEWGLLHGIQMAKFVETSSGQERIENVLNKLVTSTDKTMRGPSADANNLAEVLSNSCYHFFSTGNRNAFLGFQTAQEAMTLPIGHPRRDMKTAEAAGYLLKAAKFWYSPTLVTGQLLQTQDSGGFVEVAERAIRHNSPLAKACSCLVELRDVASVVKVCLATAENFNSTIRPTSKQFFDAEYLAVAHPWEIGLYHKRQDLLVDDLAITKDSPGKTTAQGTNVTPKEAINTCFSLVFYYTSKFLDSPVSSDVHHLGEDMVSVCAFQADKSFLHAFFAFMLKDNHKGVLLRLTSSELEEWLMGKQMEDPDLLMNYYQVQKQFRKAGELARNRAGNTSSRINLDTRIELLGIAVTSLGTALDIGENVAQYKTETELELSVAILQRKILHALENTDYEFSTDDREQLEQSLVHASDLLNKFAARYDLFDLCLLLFATCREDNQVYIKKLWKSFICMNVFPCSTRNDDVYRRLLQFASDTEIQTPKEKITLLEGTGSSDVPLFDNGTWTSKLEDAVVHLGQEIIAKVAEFAFPVEFVASCLEGENDLLIITIPVSFLLLFLHHHILLFACRRTPHVSFSSQRWRRDCHT